MGNGLDTLVSKLGSNGIWHDNLQWNISNIQRSMIILLLAIRVLRDGLHYGGEVHRSWILGEFKILIGQEQHSCPVVIYSAPKSPLVENIVHGWKKMTWMPTWRTLFRRGVLWRSSFLGNLKASDKKLDLRRTPAWIKYCIVFSSSPAYLPSPQITMSWANFLTDQCTSPP